MVGWSEVSRTPVIRRPRDPSTDIIHATCSEFDKHSDLVWIGDSSGYVGSYADTVLAPYTRFAAHEGSVRQLLSYKKGVVSIDSNSIRLTNRRGLLIFKVTNKEIPQFKNLAQIAYISTNEILITAASNLIQFDLNKGAVLSIIPHEKEIILMSSNKRFVALGNVDGTIDVFNPKTNEVIKTFTSNSSTLSDIDLKDNTLVSCGYSLRHGNHVLDPFVNVYDLRTLKSLPPIPFPAGASFVRLHPRLSSSAIIASKTGQIQVVDVHNPSDVQLYQVDVGPKIVSFELSSTGDYLGIVDHYSLFHLWCQNPELSQMSERTPLEYPSLPRSNDSYVDVDDHEVPLNSIGLPYYKENLLSAWSSQAIFRSAGTIPKNIDPTKFDDLKNIRIDNSNTVITEGQYDKEKYGRRNQAKKYVSLSNGDLGRFLSAKNVSSPLKKKVLSDDSKEQIFDIKKGNPPNAFKKLEILYSKFGVEDFDFDSYNSTYFSGLESHVDNSYTNALIQLYRFVPEFFSFLVSNLAFENLHSNDLLRELGYLYDMLVKSNGRHFRPTNFQHNLSYIPEASQLGLIKKEILASDGSSDAQRLKVFNRFLLNKISYDERKQNYHSQRPNSFDKIFGIEIEVQKRHSFSSNSLRDLEIHHSLDAFLTDNHFKQLLQRNINPTIITFLEASMSRIEQIKNEHGAFEQSKIVRKIPPVLSVDLHLSQAHIKSIRTTKDWLKAKFYAARSNNGYVLVESLRNQDTSEFYQQYELVGFVAEISGEIDKDKHLVTFLQTYDETNRTKNWFLFNDFLVLPIAEEEALNLQYWWKTPVTLVYRNTSTDSKFCYDGWKYNINDEILYRDHFAAGTREGKRIEYELLTKEEAPNPGTLVAIDAEFVIIEEEQFELKSNGSRSLLKPSYQTLARVSVLRGDEGPKFGVPFIDDYVVVHEPIHDYLTSFSGIEPGDLDPQTSNKPLVEREVVYRKLWLLLNLGCVFVGHGLTNDFRTINISVPKSQVRDTAVFFYKGQRILSLRYLAYSLLNKRVQTGNHDSIEDAHTALLIYKEYEILKSNGSFEETLNTIYKEGQILKFKPPEENN
ncbi:hypothetical protein WICMUC_000629 [Wickerhamomyces mucosus]|uniref:PAN2-PAN3 deadenylation complex catalytic subunit PAN2 n=1 Tax=Wickerhamomyces mucosus TaxID=1378264 RepID=A0A9P8PWZ0_9ASCO|nr:hypothetical protein WICMUC_000629 [Wickerhamomyces mucosus]